MKLPVLPLITIFLFALLSGCSGTIPPNGSIVPREHHQEPASFEDTPAELSGTAVTVNKHEAIPEKGDNSEAFQEDNEILPDKPVSQIGATLEDTFQHEKVSHFIEGYSQGIDRFFGDDRIYEEFTETFASLKLSTLHVSGDGLSLDGKFRLSLNLPRTKRRLFLQFASEDVEFQEDESRPDRLGFGDSTDEDAKVSLRYVLQETRKWHVSISPGLKISKPLDPYFKLRMRRSYDFLDCNSRIVQTFERYRSTGYGSKSTLILERSVLDQSLIRSTAEAYRNEEEFSHRDFEVSQKLALYYPLTSRDILSTEAGVYGRTDPSWRDERYFCNFRWRKNIHKGFLFLELKPQLDYERENDFRSETSINITLEVLYGAHYR